MGKEYTRSQAEPLLGTWSKDRLLDLTSQGLLKLNELELAHAVNNGMRLINVQKKKLDEAQKYTGVGEKYEHLNFDRIINKIEDIDVDLVNIKKIRRKDNLGGEQVLNKSTSQLRADLKKILSVINDADFTIASQEERRKKYIRELEEKTQKALGLKKKIRLTKRQQIDVWKAYKRWEELEQLFPSVVEYDSDRVISQIVFKTYQNKSSTVDDIVEDLIQEYSRSYESIQKQRAEEEEYAMSLFSGMRVE